MDPESHVQDLQSAETLMGSRLTNIGFNAMLYPSLNLPLAVNCHPYHPTEVLGEDLPACAAHVLVVKYDQDFGQQILPRCITEKLSDLGISNYQLFLNVQDNPWNGTTIQLRAHAFSDFFPTMGENYQGVHAVVLQGDAAITLNEEGAVHLHDGIASPSNFSMPGLDHTQNQDFYSMVTFDKKTVITHHILLTVAAREKFQNTFCEPTKEDRSPNFFSPLLGGSYAEFLQFHGAV